MTKDPKTRRANVVVTTIAIRHDVETVAASHSVADVQAAIAEHNAQVGPVLEALAKLGVDVTTIGPEIVGRHVPIKSAVASTPPSYEGVKNMEH